VVADGRLGEVECRGQLADAYLAAVMRADQGYQPEPDRVAVGLEDLREPGGPALTACTSTATSTSASGEADRATAPTLTGSGSTFDEPFFGLAFARYHQQHPGVTVGYSAVGSSAGIAAFSTRQADFGASDVPMTATEQATAQGGPVVQVPVDLGAEGVVYSLNLPAGAGLHLTGPVIARIFLGQITSWHDSAVTALNPGLSLPDAPIHVVHRSDGSGTAYIFSNYLSSVDPAWAAKVGTGKTLNWPAGEGAAGNAGVASAIYRSPSPSDTSSRPIAQGLLLPFAAIRNQAGHYVNPVRAVRHRRRRPETRHHAGRLLHRQPARRQQLPHQRIQLGACLRPPAKPSHRARTGQPPGLAHPHRPGLRRRHQLRTPATQNPATRPHHAPVDNRPDRRPPPELSASAGTTALCHGSWPAG
jgi:phosphate ABC transporter phosphate-binding protein